MKSVGGLITIVAAAWIGAYQACLAQTPPPGDPSLGMRPYAGPQIMPKEKLGGSQKRKGNASAAWASTMAAINQAGQYVIANMPKESTEQDKYDAYLQMFGAIESAYLTLVASDPDHPAFVPWLGLYENLAQPNVDSRYLMTSVTGEGVYRITGKLGDVPKQLLAILGPSDFVNGSVSAPLSAVDLTTLHHDPDGHFDLLLSASRPAEYKGEWRPLDRKAKLMFLRIDSDDWGNQREPSLAIDRMDVPSRASRRSVADLEERLRMIAPYVQNTPLRWLPHLNALPENRLEFTNYGFAPTQRYMEGQFKFGKDEALILETDLPKSCRYWSWGLANMLFASLDWVNNQASLNRSQAQIDKDGKLRIVIAFSDPGVPNWLDTVGRSHGTIGGRWYQCSSNPLPTVKKVPLADVRKYLPADTPAVTPEQRDQILRKRRDAAQFRGLW